MAFEVVVNSPLLAFQINPKIVKVDDYDDSHDAACDYGYCYSGVDIENWWGDMMVLWISDLY